MGKKKLDEFLLLCLSLTQSTLNSSGSTSPNIANQYQPPTVSVCSTASSTAAGRVTSPSWSVVNLARSFVDNRCNRAASAAAKTPDSLLTLRKARFVFARMLLAILLVCVVMRGSGLWRECVLYKLTHRQYIFCHVYLLRLQFKLVQRCFANHDQRLLVKMLARHRRFQSTLLETFNVDSAEEEKI